MESGDSFRPDVFLQAFKEIQKEKCVNEHSLKTVKEEMKLLEHRLKEGSRSEPKSPDDLHVIKHVGGWGRDYILLNASFSSVRNTRNKMNEMKEVAECKLANNQEVIERLTAMREAKMSTIAQLIDTTSEEQTKQSQQIRTVEDKLDLLASHFRHAKTYYADHSLNTQVDTLTCKANELQQQVTEEATVTQLTETVQALHITDVEESFGGDTTSHLDKEIILQMLEDERDQLNNELQQLFKENDRLMAEQQHGSNTVDE
ncbi:uncharacterized protein [Dysidea avara]|uniref:uncharacterized protein isoform X3 n=1 Tax=Dysidea avara TaxID=196820 RepID=UPI003331F642